MDYRSSHAATGAVRVEGGQTMQGIRNTTSTGPIAGRRIVCAVIGLTGFLVVVVPARVAQAATDVVTNCSGAPASVGSLPYEVANATAGDTVTFACRPPVRRSCSPAAGQTRSRSRRT